MSEAWRQWEGHVLDGRYTLRDFQGSTDHSAVFVTEYGKLREKVAIKFIETPRQGSAQQLACWERAAKLSHPHLIRLLDWGQCRLGDVPMFYVVTEFADENLAQILPNRALTPSEAEYMLRSALEVLSYLHNAGLVHGRLKPSNLMAVGDDLKLSSDSICAAGEKTISAREPTVYDAPELATSGATRACDIWSLGITLVEALTQRRAPREAMRQLDPALPDTLPAPFLEIARQCLRLDPERRWTVADVAARLLPAPAARPRLRIRSPYVPAAVVLVVGALFAGAKLFRQGSVTVDRPAAQASVAAKKTAPTPDNPNARPDNRGTQPSPLPATPAPVNTAPPSQEALAPQVKAPAPPSRQTTVASSIPGTVAEQVVPTVSQRSRDTITGKVRVSVRVQVDASGRVVDATLASPGPSRYFANVALDASRRWKFNPPQAAGEAVASEWMLRFAFRREGVDVSPAQLSPESRGN